jgi:hypothetical protein
MRFVFLKTVLVILWCIGMIENPAVGAAQNRVSRFTVEKRDGQIEIRIDARNPIEAKLIPFETRRYAMIQIGSLEVARELLEEVKKELQTLPFKVHAIPMMDGSFLITLKGKRAEDIQLTGNGTERLVIRITSRNQPVQKQAGQGEMARRFLQEAWQHYRSGRSNLALKRIHDVIKLERRNAEAYFLAGKIRLERNELEKAKINFRISKRYGYSDAKAIDQYLLAIARMERRDEKAGNRPRQKRNARMAKPVSKSPHESARPSDSDSLTAAVSAAHFPEKGDSLPQEHFAVELARKGGAQEFVKTAKEQLQSSDGSGKKSGRLLQYVLFFSILGFPAFWTLLFFKLKKKSGTAATDPHRFARMLDLAQKVTGPIGVDMPGLQEAEGTRKNGPQENVKAAPEDGAMEAGRWVKPVRPRYPVQDLNETEKKILYYASMGFSVDELARMFHRGKGEIEVLLSLAGKSAPMHAPSLRIELAE